MSNWSVIKTRSRWEKKVARLLKQKGIDTFCPLLKAKRQWSDRVKTIEQPLLKSYVFVKVAEDQRKSATEALRKLLDKTALAGDFESHVLVGMAE